MARAVAGLIVVDASVLYGVPARGLDLRGPVAGAHPEVGACRAPDAGVLLAP